MYKFYLANVVKAHQYEELIKIFLKPDEFMIYLDEKDENCSNTECIKESDTVVDVSFSLENHDREDLKRQIFKYLVVLTGKYPKWGAITGIRPLKMYQTILEDMGSREKANKRFAEKYLTTSEKINILDKISQVQDNFLPLLDDKSIGIYIGIPFCPTRCHYCSFITQLGGTPDMEAYVEALIKEIIFVAGAIKDKSLNIESLYIGGGTPTTLSEDLLGKLLSAVNKYFDLSECKEFTVEAGRADTINENKLKILKENNVDRISINPQTMKDETLNLIGRRHSVQEFVDAYQLARKVGFANINADVIAGLPNENKEDFIVSLKKILKLDPTSITIHTLAIKKSAIFKETNDLVQYDQIELIDGMLDEAYKLLDEYKFNPYYIYRQKNMSYTGENVGFAKQGYENIYNARIMGEKQSILALGAGGISKRYYPDKDLVVRVPNVSNYEVYIDRIDEMIERKINKFFV
ncbi:MAG: coproporphyrinogen dehydrogenase HemZ [Eubacteriales bacterium]|nr:coproporphyrinogen dehydrogenase HemZ [Eubacteriales bacterium]MDY3332816.1 coproporphyrinogen dehydrogenase HemZ [Gallibacter sp.]